MRPTWFNYKFIRPKANAFATSQLNRIIHGLTLHRWSRIKENESFKSTSWCLNFCMLKLKNNSSISLVLSDTRIYFIVLNAYALVHDRHFVAQFPSPRTLQRGIKNVVGVRKIILSATNLKYAFAVRLSFRINLCRRKKKRNHKP
jgi:hypothetical protein